MTLARSAKNNITQRFDRAAECYDKAASVQAFIAKCLADTAFRQTETQPDSVLDIGCGTGFAAGAIARLWPLARITAMDGAPAMLKETQRKLPHLHIVTGDIAQGPFEPSFDLILSSMALHWLDDPSAALRRWQQWLKPKGKLFAALLVDGTFAEWRELCAGAGLTDGLWPMPPAAFADHAADATREQTLKVSYPSAGDFLHRLKATGAAMPRVGHKPFSAATLRRLLNRAPKPFIATYRVLYITTQSSDSI